MPQTREEIVGVPKPHVMKEIAGVDSAFALMSASSAARHEGEL